LPRNAALGHVVLAAVFVAASGPAALRADSSADEAEARFRRGADLYRQARFDEALLEFFSSNRLAPNKNVVFNIARSFEALGRYDEAYQYYDAYRVAEAAPRERDGATAKLNELAPRVALLVITSEPAGATIYVDRKDLGGHGETPATVSLAPGRHRILVEREGYEPAETEASVRRGARTAVALVLHPIVGRVRIEARPSAEVRVDRAEDDAGPPDVRATPATLSLPPGRHALELRGPGYRPLRRLIVVEPRDEQVIRVDLEKIPPPSGSVAVSADVAGAEVSVDGKPYGPAPLVGDLVQGRHAVRVDASGYEPWTREIDVREGGHLFLAAELHEHEPEVQAATRTAQRLGEAPASVSLVTREELEVFDRETLSDAPCAASIQATIGTTRRSASAGFRGRATTRTVCSSSVTATPSTTTSSAPASSDVISRPTYRTSSASRSCAAPAPRSTGRAPSSAW
jgi:outer membrane receptor for ferrienterochelin and colicins